MATVNYNDYEKYFLDTLNIVARANGLYYISFVDDRVFQKVFTKDLKLILNIFVTEVCNSVNPLLFVVLISKIHAFNFNNPSNKIQINAKDFMHNYQVMINTTRIDKPATINFFNQYDDNDLTDLKYLEGRKTLIKNFLFHNKLGINVDESVFKSCFDFYEQEELDINQIKDKFLFIVKEGNKNFISSISFQDMTKIINDPNTVYLHCLRNEDTFHPDYKKTIVLSDVKLIQIPNAYGTNWLIYLANLKTIIQRYQTTVFYLIPAMKIKYRQSISASNYIDRPNYVGNQHCQEGIEAIIYGIEICKDECILSNKFKFDLRYFKDIFYNILMAIPISELLLAFDRPVDKHNINLLFERIYKISNDDIFNYQDFIDKLIFHKNLINKEYKYAAQFSHYFDNLISLFNDFLEH